MQPWRPLMEVLQKTVTDWRDARGKTFTVSELLSLCFRGSLELMAAMRNTALNLFRSIGVTNIAAARRSYAWQPHRVVHLLTERCTFEQPCVGRSTRM